MSLLCLNYIFRSTRHFTFPNWNYFWHHETVLGKKSLLNGYRTTDHRGSTWDKIVVISGTTTSFLWVGEVSVFHRLVYCGTRPVYTSCRQIINVYGCRTDPFYCGVWCVPVCSLREFLSHLVSPYLRPKHLCSPTPPGTTDTLLQ